MRWHSLNTRVQKSTLSLGEPEAEAEASDAAKVPLMDVFDDYFNIIEQLNGNQFILTARKGAGKTAIGCALESLAADSPNSFCKFIRKQDLDLQSIVQIGEASGKTVEIGLLFRWAILCKSIEMITSSASIENTSELRLLKEFITRNSGFTEVNSYRIKEFFEKSSMEGEIKIEYLKRFLNAKKSKSLETKSDKAPFYALIPHLEEVVTSILKEDQATGNENEYWVIFDDLDIGVNQSNEASLRTLLDLLRVAKDFNLNKFWGKNLRLKVVILMRDDIRNKICDLDADSAKLLSSYEVPLNWYDDELFRRDENLLPLKQFINKRIRYANSKSGLRVPEGSEFEWLFPLDRNPSSFKFLLDSTFYRPRDLLLFFKPLSSL